MKLEHHELLYRMVFFRRWFGTWQCRGVRSELHCLHVWGVDTAPYLRAAIKPGLCYHGPGDFLCGLAHVVISAK